MRSLHVDGMENVDWHAFKKQYIRGSDAHADLEEHKEIAHALTLLVRQKMDW